MAMSSRSNRREIGTAGEREVADLIACPNCRKRLMLLPPSFPLYDLQCTGCSFRAQVKTANKKPTSRILGAGWDIIDKVTKAGFMMPPLIVNFTWIEKGERRKQIRFYPFIPKQTLHHYVLSKRHPRAGYKMFSYRSLNTLPHFILYSK